MVIRSQASSLYSGRRNKRSYSNYGAERMKKEWMYFIAGAGLIGAIMFFTMSAEHSTYKECMVKEMQKMPKDSNPAYVSAYCYEKHG